MDQFSSLPFSTWQSQAIAFSLLVVIGVSESITDYVQYKKTGIRRQDSWQFYLLFNIYALLLISVLDQLGGTSHIGIHPGALPFWFLAATAILATYITYRRNQKTAAH
ncbi:hypothetical protein ACFOU0_10645 [Salinicoccus sesuvii]|uniref:Uncharacterized protein n=1 Tax=Salinicoccus sesuvii TaxID=868281 RepID=A0ABV7N8L2_9STAP